MLAGYNFGVVLGQLDRFEEELAAYEQLISDYSEDPTPAIRAAISRAVEALREIGEDASG